MKPIRYLIGHVAHAITFVTLLCIMLPMALGIAVFDFISKCMREVE